MTIDDLGIEAGRDLVRASQSLGRPSLEAVTKNRRARAGLGTALVFTLAALLVGMIAVVTPEDDGAATATTTPPQTTTVPPGTTVPPAAQPVGTVFVPPTSERDGMTEVTLTLLDGSMITVAYPSELDLASRGFMTALATRHGEDRNDWRTSRPMSGRSRTSSRHAPIGSGPVKKPSSSLRMIRSPAAPAGVRNDGRLRSTPSCCSSSTGGQPRCGTGSPGVAIP